MEIELIDNGEVSIRIKFRLKNIKRGRSKNVNTESV